jgi:hypothetical protein
MVKESIRLFHWFLFLLKTGYLRNVYNITEIGAGESIRVQMVLSLLLYRGKFLSVDYASGSSKKAGWFLFKPKFIKTNFFKFKGTADLLIFDHSIDDILAGMIDKHSDQKEYGQLMDSIKLFNYNDPKFIRQISRILTHAKTLISYGGRIIISNYLTKYDEKRGTVTITLQLLPQLSKIAKRLNLKVDCLSNRFLVLRKN